MIKIHFYRNVGIRQSDSNDCQYKDLLSYFFFISAVHGKMDGIYFSAPFEIWAKAIEKQEFGFPSLLDAAKKIKRSSDDILEISQRYYKKFHKE